MAEPNTEGDPEVGNEQGADEIADETVPFGVDTNQTVPGQGPPNPFGTPDESGGTEDETNRPTQPEAQKALKMGEKAGEQAAKTAAKTGTRAAASAIWAFILANWPIVLIAIAALIALVIGAIAISDLFSNPNPRGGTIAQPAEAVADKPWLEKFLALAGDKDISDFATAKFSEKFTQALSEITSELDKPENKDLPHLAEIRTVIEKINVQYSIIINSGTTAAARLAASNQMKVLCNSLANFASASPIQFNGPRSLPFTSDLSKEQLAASGKTFHGRSLRRPADIKGHRVFQFFEITPPIGDAADISDPGDKSDPSKTAPLLAVMDGKLYDYTMPSCANRSPRCSVYYLDGKDSSGHTFRVTYAHMIDVSNKLKPNDRTNGLSVTQGQQIGRVGLGHLHIEITIDGKPVNYSDPDINGSECGGLTDDHSRCKTGIAPAVFFWRYVTTIFKP